MVILTAIDEAETATKKVSPMIREILDDYASVDTNADGFDNIIAQFNERF